jgi:hypothetical protein
MPFTRSGSPMISAIVIRGISDENGSWKIIRICRRSRSRDQRQCPAAFDADADIVHRAHMADQAAEHAAVDRVKFT